MYFRSYDVNPLKYYYTKVEKYIKKLRDIMYKSSNVDLTDDEASENYINHLTELWFKVTSIFKSVYSFVDLLNSKKVCESAVLKSISVAAFSVTYLKLQLPCFKLSSVYKSKNKIALSDPCHLSSFKTQKVLCSKSIIPKWLFQ